MNKRKKPPPKIVVVMPAYNAEKTLKLTYDGIPKDIVDLTILVDDASKDETLKIARNLNMKIFLHNKNYGYGANQKTCYVEALKENADIIVMVHPDYQYDPMLLPQLVSPIKKGKCDVVLGSRILAGNVLKRGMPVWKYISNRFLTSLENLVLRKKLTEYHTGYRAYTSDVLKTVPFILNSDNFIFDQEILFQICHHGFKVTEVPIPARYFPEASSAGFFASLRYGFSILLLILKYVIHQTGIVRLKQFESPYLRYTEI